jgi:GTP cyclohydrolase IA
MSMNEKQFKFAISDWLADGMLPEAHLAEVSKSESRIRRAYGEYLGGYAVDPQSLVVIVDDGYTPGGCVEQLDIPFYSMCAHHFLPFWGKATVRYWPTTKLIGLGKLPRLIHCFSARLTMQEHIAREVAEFLCTAVGASKAEVELEARHLCVEARGPGAVGSTTRCKFAVDNSHT